jgi:hypothetical protein
MARRMYGIHAVKKTECFEARMDTAGRPQVPTLRCPWSVVAPMITAVLISATIIGKKIPFRESRRIFWSAEGTAISS